MEDISRRSFLTGAVAVAGIAATAGLAGCAPQQTSEATAGSSAQAAPAGSGKTTIGQTQHGWAMHRRSKNRTS